MNLGCFCYLVNHKGYNSINTCVKSLTLLNNNYLQFFPTPVILFHEAGLIETMKQTLIQASKAPLTFVQLEFKVPEHIKNIIDLNNDQLLGYKHMCRFFANEIFQHPILNDFEYYCRLDTDSYILSPVTSNIFENAKNNNIKYGFINDSIVDAEWCSVGLWPLAKTYIEKHPELVIYNKLYTEIQERHLFYTNFELCYIPWFREDPWKCYFNEIDNSGGIYKYRWGDHIIRYIGVKSFMPPEQIKRITNIHYTHQGIEDNRPQ